MAKKKKEPIVNKIPLSGRLIKCVARNYKVNKGFMDKWFGILEDTDKLVKDSQNAKEIDVMTVTTKTPIFERNLALAQVMFKINNEPTKEKITKGIQLLEMITLYAQDVFPEIARRPMADRLLELLTKCEEFTTQEREEMLDKYKEMLLLTTNPTHQPKSSRLDKIKETRAKFNHPKPKHLSKKQKQKQQNKNGK